MNGCGCPWSFRLSKHDGKVMQYTDFESLYHDHPLAQPSEEKIGRRLISSGTKHLPVSVKNFLDGIGSGLFIPEHILVWRQLHKKFIESEG